MSGDELDEIHAQYLKYEVLPGDNPLNHAYNNWQRTKAALLAYVDRQRVDELIKLRGASSIDDGYVRMPEMLEARLRVLRKNLNKH